MKIKEHDPSIQMPLLKFAEKRKKESCKNCTVDFFGGGFIILRDLFFWVRFCLIFIFLGIKKNVWADPPYHIHVRVHSLGLNVS